MGKLSLCAKERLQALEHAITVDIEIGAAAQECVRNNRYDNRHGVCTVHEAYGGPDGEEQLDQQDEAAADKERAARGVSRAFASLEVLEHEQYRACGANERNEGSEHMVGLLCGLSGVYTDVGVRAYASRFASNHSTVGMLRFRIDARKRPYLWNFVTKSTEGYLEKSGQFQ